MKSKKILRISLTFSAVAFALSFFNLFVTYGIFLEVKNLVPYITPQPAHLPTTAIFPSTFVGRFLLVTSSSLLAILISIVVLICLAYVLRK